MMRHQMRVAEIWSASSSGNAIRSPLDVACVGGRHQPPPGLGQQPSPFPGLSTIWLPLPQNENLSSGGSL